MMPKINVSMLTDKELVDTWGWMQISVPPESHVARVFTDEITKRKLTAPATEFPSLQAATSKFLD